MKAFIARHHRPLFFGSWFLINLLQAAHTGLLDDEAYYWVYSQYPAWGYFDHPPMIGWLIAAGSFLFPGELGVRIFIVLLNTATIAVIYRLIPPRRDFLFYAICLSLAVAQIGGILAVPDLPLLFFTALFFLGYRRFLYRADALAVLFLSISIALMMYSKYHGVLVILFTLLSNPRLLLRYQSWLVVLISLILLAPHIYWQWQQGMPSVQYHLFERNAPAYQFSFTIEYLAGQLALAGPVVGWLLLYAAFAFKTRDLLEKALKFSMVGIFIFFLISSLRGRIEANWTVQAYVAVIVLSTAFLAGKPRLEKLLYRLLPVTILLVLTLRIFMALDLPRSTSISKDEVHGNEEWVGEIKARAGALPVVFMNTYQNAAKFHFYGGQPAMSYNAISSRRNNYNFWPIEDSLFKKEVLIVGWRSVFTENFVHPYLQELGSRVIDNYYSFSRVRLTEPDIRAMSADEQELSFQVEYPKVYQQYFQDPMMDSASVYLSLLRENQPVILFATGIKVNEFQKDKIFRVRVPVSAAKGKHHVKLAITSRIQGFPTVNSTGFTMQIPD